jgi:heme A synthase
LVLLTSSAVLLQLLLGAAFRHKGLGILPHMLWAVVVTVLIGWTAWRVLAGHKEPALRTPAMALLLLVVLQLGLGMAAYMGRVAGLEAPQPLPWVVGLTVAHVAAGALTLASSVALTLQAFRLIAIQGKTAGLVPASGNSSS